MRSVGNLYLFFHNQSPAILNTDSRLDSYHLELLVHTTHETKANVYILNILVQHQAIELNSKIYLISRIIKIQSSNLSQIRHHVLLSLLAYETTLVFFGYQYQT